MTAVDATVLERLRGFDTATICNVIELFAIRPQTEGYMDERIRASYPDMPAVVGFASTATFRASSPPRGRDSYTDLDDQVAGFAELSGPAFVVFQDLDDPSVAATFGEVMCTVYRAFGAVGLVTSGTGRDLDQVRALEFPTFTAGTNPSHGYPQTVDVGVPVRVGGLVVHPDDLLHGDQNGVTSIPKEIAAQVAEITPAFMESEQLIFDALSSGDASPAALREARAEGQERVRALRAEIGRRSG
jgi:4-hydroxy-4-methyl-2-oxoglutarate aldolase